MPPSRVAAPFGRLARGRATTRLAAASLAAASLAGALLVAGCRDATAPEGRLADPTIVRARACAGPATSLDPTRAAALRPGIDADAFWAELSGRVPGGFAGLLYEPGPVLLLADPSRAAEARAALGPELGADVVAAAGVRGVRWTFAQLYDWNRWLMAEAALFAPGSGVTMSDIDEAVNRLYFGAIDEAARDRLVTRLEALGVPCDLVLVGVAPFVSTAGG